MFSNSSFQHFGASWIRTMRKSLLFVKTSVIDAQSRMTSMSEISAEGLHAHVLNFRNMHKNLLRRRAEVITKCVQERSDVDREVVEEFMREHRRFLKARRRRWHADSTIVTRKVSVASKLKIAKAPDSIRF